MNSKITYHQQVTYCGKPRCRKCRDGIGHGPYWYAYQTIDGRTTRTYIGKKLPSDVQVPATIQPVAVSASTGEQTMISAPVSPHNAPAASDQADLRIFMLGPLRIERQQQQQFQPVSDSAWQQRAVRSLFGFLLCAPERRASQLELTAALWPELDISSATNSLNRAVRGLTRALGHVSTQAGRKQELPGVQLLRTEDEWFYLAGQELIWTDVDAFEARAALCLAEPLEARTVAVPQREQELLDAISLYKGTFLPEEHDAVWAVTRRQSLQRQWSDLLLDLADLYIARVLFGSAIEYLDRLLARDPTNESAVQRLIIVLSGLKRRGEALRAYDHFVKVLQHEYEIEPSAQTRALYDSVRLGRELPTLIPPVPQGDPALTATAATSDTSLRRGSLRNRDVPVETIGRIHQSPLVGRDSELNVMRAVLLEIEQGAQRQLVGPRGAASLPLDTQRRPQCMVLMGDAGIGKTRLAEELSREARQRGWAVVLSRLYNQESSVPYRLWTETLRKTLDLGTGLLPDFDPQQLQPLTALLPELHERIPQAGLDLITPPPHALTPEQARLRLWEATGDLLKQVSSSTALLIVLDDIQWADESSYDLLGYLARHLYGYPVVFLVTCRDTELPKKPPHAFRKLVFHMQREHTIKTLNVEPLSSEQIGTLVARLSRLPEATVKRIQDQADGNPFFAEELARSTPPTLPRTVTDALKLRLNRLSGPCQQLLGNAAVLGGSFEFQLILSMETSRDMVDEDLVLDLLDEALQAGVLNDEGTGSRITYHFWHPLLVSHLYEHLSAVRRALLHLRAADTIQRMHTGHEAEVAATIAYHLVKGGAPSEQIAYYAELAGNQAYTFSIYNEAQKHYRLAVEQMELAHVQKEQQKHFALLLERFAECNRIHGNFAEARQLYERVRVLHTQLTYSDDEAQREAQVQALLWGEIGLTWRYTGDHEHAGQCIDSGEQVLRTAHITDGPAWARLYYLRSTLYRGEGRYDEALHVAQEALILFEQQQQQSSVATREACATNIQRTLDGDPVNLGLTYRFMGTVAEAVGQLSNALSLQSRALALYEQYDEKRQIAHLSCDMGYIHLKKGDFAHVKAELRRSQSLAERIGDEPLLALIYSDWGELYTATGDLEEAEAWYRRALELATEDREYISIWNAGLASVLQDLNRLDEAATCVKRAWRIGRAIRKNSCIGLALVAMGNLRLTQALASDQKSKRQHLLKNAHSDIQRALALGKLEVETRIRGQLALAHITLLQGQRQQAHTDITQVIAEAQRYELVLVTERARWLLQQT